MASGTASKTVNDSTSNERPPSPRWTARDVAQIVLFALLVKPFMALFIGLRVRGREHLPRNGQFILVANHASHLDTISLLALFRLTHLRRIRPVAAADYFERNRFVSFLTKTFFNILPIARRGITAENNPMERMQQALAAGDSLILFPEGTRGSGQEIGPFRSGIAHLVAKLPEVPVVPAYLANMGRSLPKGEIIPVPFFCEIRLGAPLKCSGARQQIVRSLEDAVRALKEA